MNIGETEEGVCKSVSVIVSGVCEPKGVPKIPVWVCSSYIG